MWGIGSRGIDHRQCDASVGVAKGSPHMMHPRIEWGLRQSSPQAVMLFYRGRQEFKAPPHTTQCDDPCGLVGVQAFTPHARQRMCLQEDATTQQEDEEEEETAESSAAGTASKGFNDTDTEAEESQVTQQHVWHHDCVKVSTLWCHQLQSWL